MLPIARWLQRRAIWLAGYNEDSVKTFLDDNHLNDAPFEPVQFEVEGEIPNEPELVEGATSDSDDGSVLGGNGGDVAWV